MEYENLESDKNLIETINEIRDEQKELRIHVEHLVQMVAKQNDLLERMLDDIYPMQNDVKLFPIRTMEDLLNIDNLLRDASEHKEVLYMKEFIGKAPITKCFDMFFMQDVLLQINWNGNNKKFPINSLKTFNTYLYEAVKKDTFGYKDYEECMRKNIANAKNRIYKHRYRDKQNKQKLEYLL